MGEQKSDGVVKKKHGSFIRDFIPDKQLRNTTLDGVPGVRLKVQLSSYRSLPLSCIGRLEVRIDDQWADPDKLVLTLNNTHYKLRDLPRLNTVWWFILDLADLFVPRSTPLTPGLHEVEGRLATVEPYMTAGRFTFNSSTLKHLTLETD